MNLEKLLLLKNRTTIDIRKIKIMLIFGTMDFNFYIEKTKEPLNGIVYLGNKLLGHTQNGTLIVDKNKIYPGEIKIQGTYSNKPFTFYFNFLEDEFSYGKVNFSVSQNELENVLFSVEYVDTEDIADQIFELINFERRRRDITELKRCSILDDIAKEHCDDMIKRKYYAHTTPDGKSLDDRIHSY